MLLFVIICLALLPIVLSEHLVSSYRIPKGAHRAWPFRFGLYYKPLKLSWKVSFDYSTYYMLSGPDQADINKLVGIGYMPGIHKNSARFGWRCYDTTRIELFAYVYDKGVRSSRSLGLIERNYEYRLDMNVYEARYCLSVYDITRGKYTGLVNMTKTHKKKLGIRLGVFFGGNKTAPNDMKVFLKRS